LKISLELTPPSSYPKVTKSQAFDGQLDLNKIEPVSSNKQTFSQFTGFFSINQGTFSLHLGFAIQLNYKHEIWGSKKKICQKKCGSNEVPRKIHFQTQEDKAFNIVAVVFRPRKPLKSLERTSPKQEKDLLLKG